MPKESIYRYILRMSEKHPGRPYRFQNPMAGKDDVSQVLWGEKLFFPLREKFALDLVDLVIPCLPAQSPSKVLLKRLKQWPLFLYISDLNRRFKLLLSEGLVDAQQLYAFGMKLATESEIDTAVKLGMIILSHFENDVTARVLRTLGLHSSLTLYAIEASRNFRKRNQFVYDLAKNTCGYGKLISLHDLQPIRQEQKEWLFNFGAVNAAATNLSAMICLQKADMAAYYRDLELTEVSFSKLSYILAYAGEETHIQYFRQSGDLCEKYLASAGSWARSFIDLAALIVIGRSMSSPPRDEEGNARKNGWNRKREKYIRNLCRRITQQPRWEHIISIELAEPRQTTCLTILILKELGLTPVFRELVPLLQRDPFDMDMLKHLLIDNSETYLDAAAEYLELLLPKEVLEENPQNIPEDKLTPLHKPDIWLVYLLKAMRKEKRYEESLFIKCLTGRFPDVRTEAARCLRAAYAQWSINVLPALKYACAIEPVKAIEDRLERMLDRARDNGMEKRYLDVSQFLITPSKSDVPILNTQIAGAFHRDLTEVDGVLARGDTLCLIRETENRYDRLAILVTTTAGYVLGYVPRIENSIPAALMDGGEKLYAVLGNFDIEQSALEIQIRVHKP